MEMLFYEPVAAVLHGQVKKWHYAAVGHQKINRFVMVVIKRWVLKQMSRFIVIKYV